MINSRAPGRCADGQKRASKTKKHWSGGHAEGVASVPPPAGDPSEELGRDGRAEGPAGAADASHVISFLSRL